MCWDGCLDKLPEDRTIREGTVTYDIRFYAAAPQSGGMVSLYAFQYLAQNAKSHAGQ